VATRATARTTTTAAPQTPIDPDRVKARGVKSARGLTAGVAELPHRASVDETPPLHERYCDFCEETGHGAFDCSEREDWHEDQAIPKAARRLDPVCRDP
jgi:hypothetical protein